MMTKTPAARRQHAQPRRDAQSQGSGLTQNRAVHGGSISSEALPSELLSGTNALDTTVSVLARQLLSDPEFRDLAPAPDNERTLVAQLRALFSGAFDGASWPMVRLEARPMQDLATDLQRAIRDLLRRPLPLGEDHLEYILFSLRNDLSDDMRVLRLFHRIQSWVPLSSKNNVVDSTKYQVQAGPEDVSRSANGSMEREVTDHDQNASMENNEESAATKHDASEHEGNGELNTSTLDELVLEGYVVQQAQDCWKYFLSAAESKEAAGEAIYSALFEGAPSLQSLFTTPRAVQAMRFMNGLNAFVHALDNPSQLKILVETLGFGHLNLDVTPSRVGIFREAILDLLMVELAERFTSIAREGWNKMLNYIGGGIIFVKANYAGRLKILMESWAIANDKSSNEKTFMGDDGSDSGEGEKSDDEASRTKIQMNNNPKKVKKTWGGRIKRAFGGGNKDGAAGQSQTVGDTAGEAVHDKHKQKNSAQNVPTVYPEMFHFNAAVMGFGNSIWMNEVLDVFDNVVTNVSNSVRLQEECDILCLRIAKITNNVNLNDYKACMLASLRSLLPKDWSPAHEVAWTWLWENVQRLIVENLQNPAVYEKKLHGFVDSVDDETRYDIRKDIYTVFFTAAPIGQDFFKQSNTRLHFIADRVIDMTMELYADPVKMVDDISALGLRHVGYGIPTELFGPFVTATIEVIMTKTRDEIVVEAFRWSLGLIAKILVRTITEGSTIVMKAINANSTSMLLKAISCAPRGKRASWMLIVQVGTQAISPLEWAIESGSLDAAKTILVDLLTFRADRERYYYGIDHLFDRHPEIVKMLCNDAPTLLPTFLDGLIWRSRTTKNGIRRVNYYVKHLVVNQHGKVSQALQWFAAAKDCKIISHPVNVLVSDTMWKGIVRKHFLSRKSWFLLSLVVFLLSQSILPRLVKNEDDSKPVRYIILGGRVVNYLLSMGRLLFSHGRRISLAYYKRDFLWFGFLPLPRYMAEPSDLGGFALLILLICMASHEPMLYCMESDQFPTEVCPDSDGVIWMYSVFAMCAMAMHWLLIIDMSVMSTKLSAFVLVCSYVLSEVSLFVIAVCFLLCCFASAVACLRRQQSDFKDLQNSIYSLLAITLVMMPRDYRELQHDPALLFAVFLFVTCSVILLLNLLIAQLNCSYEAVYADMLGFARLNRAAVIVESLETCSQTRWVRFLNSLKLDQRCEFNEGDIGIAGGIQLAEPASLNPITHETILRYGGACSPEMQWPEDAQSFQKDRFERMEVLVNKALKRITRMQQKAKQRSGGAGTGSGAGTGTGSGGGSQQKGSEVSDEG